MVTQEASELTASRGHIKCTVTHGAIPSERDPGLAEQLLRTERIRKKLPLHWYEKNKGNTKQPEKNEQDGNSKSVFKTTYLRCKITKFSNENRLARGIKKQEPSIHRLLETHFRFEDAHRLRVKGCQKMLHAHRSQNKAGAAVPISQK